MKEREAENRLERDQAISADGTSAADLFGDAGNITGDVDPVSIWKYSWINSILSSYVILLLPEIWVSNGICRNIITILLPNFTHTKWKLPRDSKMF